MLALQHPLQAIGGQGPLAGDRELFIGHVRNRRRRQAMADEILRLRHGLARLAEAINWMKAGAPFGMIRPGPYWKPKSKLEQADVRYP